MKIVSVHIQSESSDHYDLIFTDLTPEQIREELWGNQEYYGCTIWFATKNLTKKEKESVEKVLSEVESASWDWGWG